MIQGGSRAVGDTIRACFFTSLEVGIAAAWRPRLWKPTWMTLKPACQVPVNGLDAPTYDLSKA